MTMKPKTLIFMIILLMVVSIPVQANYIDLIQSKNTVTPERARAIAETVIEYSMEYDINPDLTMAIMWTESHFRNTVGDDKLQHPACGYLQVRVMTAEKMLGYKTTCKKLIYDWKESIRAGIKYLAQQKAKYGYYGMIGSYNSGIETSSNEEYVLKVLRRKQKVEDFY